MSRSPVFVILFALCFVVGGATHARDIALGGWLPYHSVPWAVNAFWTALCPMDLIVAALAWPRWRIALWLGASVLLADVAVNSWLAYFSGLRVQSFEPLQVQTFVLGFVLGGALRFHGPSRRVA